MSYVESKVVLRIELPFLKGKTDTEAYEYFRSILGEAETVEEWEDEIEYFMYQGEFQPVSDYRGLWGVDYMLSDSSENMDCEVSILELNDKAKELSSKFGVPEANVKLFAYNWYNGGDEPISF